MPLIPDQLKWVAANHPDVVAFEVEGVGSLTPREWLADSSRLARGFLDRGVSPGDRIILAVLPEDGLAFARAYIAVHLAGAVAVPVNVRLTAPELARIIDHAGARVVVASSSLIPLLPAGLTVLDVASLADWMPAFAGELPVTRVETDLADILYTSGTTGHPKGVAIEHGNSALLTYNEAPWKGRVYLHASPMSTFAGLTFLLMSMRIGMMTLYLPRFDASTWLRLVEERRPTMVFLVPAMVEILLATDGVADRDLSSLRSVSIGSAPIAPATLGRFAELVPNAEVTNSYSMTEAGTTYCFLPRGELAKRAGSVGKPLPPAEIWVTDSSSGERVEPNVIGDVVIKPAGRRRTYFRDEEATAELYSGEWLRTGDLGYFDDDGYLYITGRAKDVIIRGGNNIYASDVEAVLYEHPAVREAAVAAIPHPVLGEDVAAYLVLKPGSSATPEELIAFCRERLADYKVPRHVELRTELPRNATGKVVKRDLVPTA